MDLEILEALALSDDRTDAIAQLLPGSEDSDYFQTLQLQHRGALDDADRAIAAWIGRHGHTERYQRILRRQQVCRLAVDPDRAADQIRDAFGVDHAHEPEVDAVDPTLPTRLEGYRPEDFLDDACAYDGNLSQVTDEGLFQLLARDLDASRRRALLLRMGHTADPQLVNQVARDLAANPAFGAVHAHGMLTLAQLDELARQRPALRADLAWVGARVQRMRPMRWVELEVDRAARLAYLETLWSFVRELPPAINSLKLHVLWHLLATLLELDRDVEPALLRAYLALPRVASYVARSWIERVKRDDLARLGVDFRTSTGLPPTGDDEALVRALLARRIDDAEAYAEWLERSWLDQELATARLLAGTGDVEQATRILGPSRAAALRERVELAWCAHNPTRFALDEAVGLDVDVKHVAELVVKVFRIDPIAYFQHQQRAVDPELDLDGLAASHEQVIRLDAPAIRRVRRRIELPMCARAGTYVVDLIGNGISSRAVIVKGRLRFDARTGAAGHVVTILDESGAPRPDARAWIGDREYVPDAHGTLVVPFSTRAGETPILLACGDLATVGSLVLVEERYQLGLDLVLDRQGLTAGRPAKAIARLAMTVADVPASVALLEKASWEVRLVDRAGVATTKSHPLVVADDDAAVLEWPLGEDIAQVSVAVRGTVKVLSQQREEVLERARMIEIATMHGEHAIETAYLAETTAGFVISALGKNGEPRAHRPAHVELTHRWARGTRDWSLGTDASGRLELGALPGATRISVDLGSGSVAWDLADAPVHARQAIADGRDALAVLPPSRDAHEVIAGASLVELRGDAPARHVAAELVPLASGVLVRGLPPGEYALRAPGIRELAITVAPVVAQLGEVVVAPTAIVRTPALPPAIAKLSVDGALRIEILGATARTRVHVVATRFFPAPVEPIATAIANRGWRDDRAQPAVYLSGRELGDEYRYILERKRAAKFPSLQLDKPPLLLHPWARRSTSTAVQQARGGGGFGRAPGAQAAPVTVGGYAGERERGGDDAARATYDFLAEPPVVLANLAIVDGVVVTVPRAALGAATSVQVVLTDGAPVAVRRIALPEPPLATRDRRLVLALDPARHARQAKQISSLLAGERLVIADLATAKLHLIDSVERAHAYLLALGDDATLREFAFVARWHALLENEQRALYSKYACHELHLFLYFRDRPFFAAVVAPALANKRTKTFVDHYLLGTDLAPWLERIAELNAVERALLARRLPADDGLPRVLDDEVAIQAPDPRLDTRIVDALIDAAALDGDGQIEQGRKEAQTRATMAADMMVAAGAASMPPPAPPAAPRMKMKKAAAKLDEMEADLDRRREAAPMFRVADTTQEWAEHNWWHQRPGELRIAANRLWRALAMHRAGPFLSRWLGLATGSFAEAMCALAVTDLPFVAGAHAIAIDGDRLELVAAGNALAGTSQLVDGEIIPGTPLVVGTSYVRHDDREAYVDGEAVPKHVTAFATGVVYTCQVVLANPTSVRQRIAALVQIPRGSLPVGGAPQTRTIDVALEPYGTHGHEYSFYLPAAGRYGHFPVHVSRGEAIIAAAPATILDVTDGGAPPDPRSWPAIAQRGSLADVVGYLATANLAAIQLDKVAWRLRERPAYDAILGALEARRVYLDALWGYALYHRDLPRIGRWLRTNTTDGLGAGPSLEMFDLDAERHGTYEHLELAPLINARAHRLGAKLRILNDGLAAQYARFLELVAHRPKPTSEDLLAAAHYLLAQDRVAPALAALGRVGDVADQLQRDYLAAYAACLSGDPARARQLVDRWPDLGVDRWRARFGALRAMLDELTGGAAQLTDATSRDQQQAELATRQPAFELAVDRDGAIVHSQHVAQLELRYFEMDVELLFSRQPFVQRDVGRFSFIEPGHRETLAIAQPEVRVPWPAALRGKNVVVEAVGAGLRKAKVHYANDLAVNLAHQYGQIRVQRASDRSALPSTYVKCYARKHDGTVAFYKDGYTDLRGWFDYASLSTDELDGVAQFALLVASELAGAAILEATPPAR